MTPDPPVVGSTFANLPSPDSFQYRFRQYPGERPDDGFLIQWLSSMADYQSLSQSLSQWFQQAGGLALTVETPTTFHVGGNGVDTRLLRTGTGFLVLAERNPPWMKMDQQLSCFDIFCNTVHGGDKPKALHALAEQYRKKLQDLAVGLAVDFSDTDAGNMERLAARWGKDCRFNGHGWHVWDGKMWCRLDASKDPPELMARMLETARFAAWGASLLGEDEAGKEKIRFLTKTSESTSRLRMALEQARGHGTLAVDDDFFDVAPWTVGFSNGVWRRGKFTLGHERDSRLTRLSKVEYLPTPNDTEDREWGELLERMVGENKAKAAMLQEVAGAAIAGAVGLRGIPWFYGPSGTGKTTFIQLLSTVLGEAALYLGPEMANGKKEEERTGAAIRGRRLLIFQEMNGVHVDTSLLKKLSGGDSVTARYLYSDRVFHVKPTWMLIAASNSEPSANAADVTFWQTRMKVVPLDERLDRGNDDRVKLTSSSGTKPAALEEVRADPASPLVRGFTRWAMEGAKRLVAEGRGDIAWTSEVVEKTETMRRELDPITEFLSHLKQERGAELAGGMTGGMIAASYGDWCEKNRVKRPLSTAKMNRLLLANGFVEMPILNGNRRFQLPLDNQQGISNAEVPKQPSWMQTGSTQGRIRPPHSFDQPKGFLDGKDEDAPF
jgi:P4 family phage/plasmid primase-like protien